MSSPEINAMGHGGPHFTLGGEALSSDGYRMDHGVRAASLSGARAVLPDTPNSHGAASRRKDTQRAQSNFPPRTTTDQQNTGKNVVSGHGFSFPKGSKNTHGGKEYKNSTQTDTYISTTEQLPQQYRQQQNSSTTPENPYNTIDYKQPQIPQSSTLDPISTTGGNGVITSEPTLHPQVDFHDSNWAEITSRANLQPRLATNPERHQNTQTANISAPNSNIHHHNVADNSTESVNGQNMGYNNTNNNTRATTAWSEPSYLNPLEQKMEHSHIRPNGRSANMTNISNRSERKDHDDDSTTIRSTDSASLGSPLHGPLPGATALESNVAAASSGAQSTVTTPSTVSTAPSTNDEGSFAALDPSALERLALRGENLDSMGNVYHRRGASWENPPYQSQLYVPDESDNGAFSRPNHPTLPPSSAQNAWHNNGQPRVASFRNDYRTVANGPEPQQQRWQQHQPQPARYETHGGHLSNRTPPPSGAPGQPPLPPHGQPVNYAPYAGPPQQQPQQQRQQLPPVTPPRATPRTPRGPQIPNQHRPSPAAVSSNPSNSNTPGSSSSGNPRSPSEVLKTLLRKKACLYEPDTSRAVALVTWLVGRELALEHGYFSRQQLQAGVHACVANKIDSGVITRTKVNRCMQIILNSCFHYIIPRPDGTEENGDAFRCVFAREVSDDVRLLRELPAPWNDLSVDRNDILEASAADLGIERIKTASPGSNPTTPQSSPKLGSIPAEKSSPRAKEDPDNDSKRAVLLCFNENVRCAEDVFRCHNEFIRDTAHASSLQLSSSEWRSFFGKDAAGAPHLWGNIGIPVPHAEGSHQVDALGMMTRSEVSKFRTSWCAKRYDHDHELCGFAHVEVNGGWLRRNPEKYNYKPEMCTCIVQFSSRSEPNGRYVVNACPHGDNCQMAHSIEEIMYHPRRYKGSVCSSLARPGGCPRGDVCPDFHPAESYKFPSKKGDGRLGSRQARQGSSAGKGSQAPAAAPILYCSPAPISRFEEQFHLPGLKNLYRRHCSVMRAHLQNPSSCVCVSSYFGDDDGTGIDPTKLSSTFKGLPQPRGV